jgi:hypothetical protein
MYSFIPEDSVRDIVLNTDSLEELAYMRSTSQDSKMVIDDQYTLDLLAEKYGVARVSSFNELVRMSNLALVNDMSLTESLDMCARMCGDDQPQAINLLRSMHQTVTLTC